MISMILALMALSGPSLAAGSSGNQAVSLELSPSCLRVSTFFDGAEVRVTGRAPTSESLALVLRGSSRTVELKRKGKVWGFLWMNVGEVVFTDVPSVYMIASPGPVCELAPYAERVRSRLGVDVLEEAATPRAEEDAGRLFAELVKLKASEGLYATREGGLHVESDASGQQAFATSLELPARIPEGDYSVELWSFSDGIAMHLTTATLNVTEIGITRAVADFARAHGLLYGLLAVVIALVAGLLTGVLFGMAGKGGH